MLFVISLPAACRRYAPAVPRETVLKILDDQRNAGRWNERPSVTLEEWVTLSDGLSKQYPGSAGTL
jgi:hypothetical protein